MGVYTLITRIDPLTVYIFDGDVQIRFCSKDYYPFDINDVEKYVVATDYTPSWVVSVCNVLQCDVVLCLSLT